MHCVFFEFETPDFDSCFLLFLEIPSQVHTFVQVGDLIGIAVKHEGFAL